MMRYQYEVQAKVYCAGCKAMHSENEVVALNIEEGPMGEDRLTFICPVDKQTYTGAIYG